MEEVTPSTSFMKKAIIGILVLVVVAGIAVAVFGSTGGSEECTTKSEVVSPADIDAESNPF